MYYGIPRSIVEAFVSMCDVCQQKKSQHNQAPLRPIISHNFLSRLQVSMYNVAIAMYVALQPIPWLASYSRFIEYVSSLYSAQIMHAISTKFEIVLHINNLKS